MNKLKILFIFIYLVLLAIPLFTFVNNGGFNALQTYEFIRLFGLFGITLIFIQIMLGAFMNYWRSVFGMSIFRFHITEGIIAYLIILSHPIFYFIYNLQTNSFTKALFALFPNITSSREIYIDLGKLGIILLTIGVMTGIFRTYPFISKHWRLFHRLNYIVFGLVLIHSFLLGTDTKTAPFVYLYPVFIIGLIASITYKLKRS